VCGEACVGSREVRSGLRSVFVCVVRHVWGVY
jgi:hypothetical protein